MSSTTDKIKGLANEAVGNVQELKGEAQKATGDVKDGAKHVADKVTGKA